MLPYGSSIALIYFEYLLGRCRSDHQQIINIGVLIRFPLGLPGLPTLPSMSFPGWSNVAIVDDHDSSIKYTGIWTPERNPYQRASFELSTTYANDTSSVATFTFTGTFYAVTHGFL